MIVDDYFLIVIDDDISNDYVISKVIESILTDDVDVEMQLPMMINVRF